MKKSSQNKISSEAVKYYEKGSKYYVKKDYERARKYFREAANRGHATAQFNLGVMHLNGEGVIKNDKEASNWFLLSANQGVADAQANLGYLYEFGRGVPEDKQEALKWYRKAADQGNTIAKEALVTLDSNNTFSKKSNENVSSVIGKFEKQFDFIEYARAL